MTLKTGTIKYSIILHIAVNMVGSVIMPAIVGDGSNIQLVGLAGIILIIVSIIGVVLLLKNRKKIYLSEGEIILDKSSEFKTIWVNTGMILYVIICLASMIYILI